MRTARARETDGRKNGENNRPQRPGTGGKKRGGSDPEVRNGRKKKGKSRVPKVRNGRKKRGESGPESPERGRKTERARTTCGRGRRLCAGRETKNRKRPKRFPLPKDGSGNLKVFIDCPEGRKIMDQNQSSYGSLSSLGAGSAFFSGAGAASFSAADFRA